MWESRADVIKHDGPEYVYEQIADDIAGMKLDSGTRLPPATELAEVYGVARMTALRAISHLQERGLVTIRQGRGTYWL